MSLFIPSASVIWEAVSVVHRLLNLIKSDPLKKGPVMQDGGN